MISLAALTTRDLVTDNQQIWNEGFGSIQGQICLPGANFSASEEDALFTTQQEHQANELGIFFIFIGLFLAGFGSTVYFSLSVSYLDDNTSR